MAELKTLARPYAQAIFELAKVSGDFASWSADLAWIAGVANDPNMQSLLAAPRLGRDQRAELLLNVVGDKISSAAKNAVRVLAHNDRLSLLTEIAALYEFLRADAENTIQATVYSSQPLNEMQQSKLTEALVKRFGSTVELHCEIDESLLGGAIVRAGDLVVDGSIKGRINQLATALNH